MDAFGLLITLPWSLLAIGLLYVLPGLTLGRHVAPGSPTPLERIGRAIATSILVGSIAALVLAFAGLLRPTVVLAILVGLAVLPLHTTRPGRPVVSSADVRRVGILALVAVAALAVAAPVLLTGPSGGSGMLPADWSSVLAALALGRDGGLPALAPAWATTRVLPVADLPGTAHLAATLQLLPIDAAARIGLDRVALLASIILVGGTLLRRWLPTWAALIGAALFAGVGGAAVGILDDPAAGRGLVLALFALWLADRALVERSRRLTAAAALVLAVVLVGQPGTFLAASAGIVGLALARWLVAKGGGPENAGGLGHRYGRRIGLRFDLHRPALAPLATAALVLIVGVAIGLATDRALALVRPAGDVLGTSPPAGPDEGPFVGVGEVPDGWRESGDETWDLERAIRVLDDDLVDPPLGAADPRFADAALGGLLATAVASMSGPGVPVVAGGALILPFAAWPFLDARRQRLVLGLLAYGLVLVGLAIATVAIEGGFGERWPTVMRLLPLQWLVAAAALAFAMRLWAAAAVGLTRRALRARGIAPNVRSAVVAVVAAGAIALAGVGSAGLTAAARTSVDRAGGLSDRGVEVYAWIARHTADDARILANGATGGVMAALANRTGIVDGPAVEPRDRPLLSRATALVLGAQVVFAEPDGDRAATYLAREGVSHLLVAGATATPADLGAVALFAVDLETLRDSSRFILVRSFGDEVLLFSVAPLF